MDLLKEFTESEQPPSTSIIPHVSDYRDSPSIVDKLGNGTTIPTHMSSCKSSQEPEVNMEPDPNLSSVVNPSIICDDLISQIPPSTVPVQNYSSRNC